MAVVLLRMTFGDGADSQRRRIAHVATTSCAALRETCIKERFALNIVPFLDAYLARESAEQGREDAGDPAVAGSHRGDGSARATMPTSTSR